MIGLDHRLLLDLLMQGQMPPGMFPGMGGPTPTATPGIAGPMPPETVLPPVRPGLKDIWRGIGAHHEGVDLPADVARGNRNAGMLDAGIALLAGAGRQNLGEAIATGLSAFRGGIDRSAESYLERSRENEEFDLKRRSTEESISSSRAATERATAEEGRRAGEYGYTQESREGARSAMKDLVREVEEIAGRDSDDADRARALFKGGPALYGDLEKHHRGVLDRKQAPEISDEATAAEIEKRKRLYAEDPQGKFERDMERRRTSAYETQVSQSGAGLSSASYLSHIRTRANQIYKAKVEQSSKFGMTDPNFDHIGAMREAEAEAEAELAGKGFSPRGGAPNPGGPSALPGVTEAEVSAVRQALSTGTEETVRQGLLLRGLPPEKIDELLRQARGQ